jgi:hypothetical protein
MPSQDSTTTGTGWAPASPVSVMDFRPTILELRLRKNVLKTFQKSSPGVLVKDVLFSILYRLSKSHFFVNISRGYVQQEVYLEGPKTYMWKGSEYMAEYQLSEPKVLGRRRVV